MTRRILLALFLALILFPPASQATDQPDPPAQPLTGPGGSAAAYDSMTIEHLGRGDNGYWLFSPDSEAVHEPLPLVVFLHGYTSIDPRVYAAWIEHTVLRGAVVVYPEFQTISLIDSPPSNYESNAVGAIRSAITALNGETGPAVNTRSLAIVGHSLGGLLAVNIAARSGEYALPPVTAVFSVQLGGCAECGGLSVLLGIPMADLSTMDTHTRVLVLVGDEDQVVGDKGAILAWRRMESIPFDRRDYIVLHSDDHGSPHLVADHYAPEDLTATGELDALDWNGTWKLFDLLLGCVTGSLPCERAMNGSSAQLDMGQWSDGVPVNSPYVTDSP